MSVGLYCVDSHTEISGCMYRGANGLKCAVGCLISDEMYDHCLEGSPVYDDIVMTAVATSLCVEVSDLNLNMLIELQEIHDAFDPSSWSVRLAELRESLFTTKETEHA